MIIRNNKSAFFNLKINKGGVATNERFAPGETKNITYLSDFKQISGNIGIRNGTFSIIENPSIEEIKVEEKIEEVEKNELMEDELLELKRAKAKTEEYLKNN